MTPDDDTPDTPPADTPRMPAPEAPASAGELEKLAGQLQAAAQERARAQDQLQRALADMQNLRRHTQRQLDESRASTLTQVVADFLPVLDNLDRATRQSRSPDELQAGLKLVLALFHGILDRRGITKIPTTGAPFDPKVHEAVATESRPELAAGTILEEIEPGYRLDQKVIRIARVKVNKTDAPTKTATSEA